MVIKAPTDLGEYQTLVEYHPHPKQLMFHLMNNKVRAFIGGKRSGKSTATSHEAVWLALGMHPFWENAPQPPVRIRVVGPDISTVVDRVNLPMIQSITPPGMAHYWREKKVLEFFNGSQIYFQTYEQEPDKFGGISLHMVVEDEEPPQAIHNENLMRLIDTGGRLLMAFSPIHGVSWSYDQIFLNEDKDDEGKILVGKVFCKTIENPYITNKEVNLIKQLIKDPDELEAHLEGSYFSRRGLVLKEFDRNKHIVEPRAAQGMIVIGIDTHSRLPEAVIFCDVDKDNNVYVFDELYEEGLIKDIALRIKQVLAGKKPAYAIIDVNAVTPDSITGTSVQREYAKHGVHTLSARKGHGSVLEGIGVMREYFRDNKLTISRKCVNLISQLNNYIWSEYSLRQRDKKDPKESPMKKADHLIDSLRFIISSRPHYRSVDTIRLPKREPLSKLTGY